MKTLLLAVVVLPLLVAALPALAGDKTYTKEQLNAMVGAGKYPPQLEPQESAEQLGFPACQAMVRKMVNDMKSNYPARVMVDKPVLLSAKVWTNDGAVVLTCSQDGKLVIQRSKYR